MSEGGCAVCLHTNTPSRGAYYICSGGSAGSISVLPLAPGAVRVHFAEHCYKCVWGNTNFYFGCGTGGGNGAYVYNRSGDTYIHYNIANGAPRDEGGRMSTVCDGWAVAHGGAIYGPDWAVTEYTTGATPTVNFDTTPTGDIVYAKSADLYVNLTKIADAESVDPYVFGLGVGGVGNPQGCNAIFNESNTYIVWVSGDQCKQGGGAGWGDRFIIYTKDAGLTDWINKSGDFWDEGARTWTGWTIGYYNSTVRYFGYS